MNFIILMISLSIIIALQALVVYYLTTARRDILKKISNSVEPKFLDISISPNSNKIFSLAIDIWRLEERLKNTLLDDTWDKEKIYSSLGRLKKFIEDHTIRVQGFTGEKYSPDITVYDLKWTEITTNKTFDGIIQDTIEPAVYFEGRLIKNAKIIIYRYNQ